MTEKDLPAAGWEPMDLSSGWAKNFGRSRARVSPLADGSWRGSASRYLWLTMLRAGVEECTGTLEFATRYAEEMAQALEAWLAGDEAQAIEHAKRAVEGEG